MINKSDYCIKGLAVFFITKQHVFTVSYFDLKVKINCLVLFVIPQWEISGWISSAGYHCCDQCAGFSPFPRQGVWLHPYRPIKSINVWCNCGFFLFFFPHLFRSYSWFTTTGPLALLSSNRAHIFTLAAPSFPPSFPSFLSLASSAI